ncbi:choice-of-anchor H family protein [Shewanella psychrotolerans]|uniref:choice-of-anchor H family protein n=1 Tax=Shewanella psychrotolerans TaxID=2864206 RepID=UPI001C6601EC|nr:choice-of-anchor H family protein [Shewanella psychrotolerans]QYK02485.1 choice-of-anchor H family protein [Shewanella psychrotolerans]
MQTITQLTQNAVAAFKSTISLLNLRILPSVLLLGLSSPLAVAADNTAVENTVAESTDTMSSVSVSIVQGLSDEQQPFSRTAQPMNAAQQLAAEQLKLVQLTPDKRKTREQVIAERQSGGDKTEKLRSASQRLNAGIYHEFSIYEASSRLFEDIDYDGFFRTFSVTFDADVHSFYVGERADVYADLYLSRNGGPWELYHTTDVFTIVDDVSDDDFEVLTTLHAGYPTDHYDVLIDLYEVGYSDIVATVSSDDLDELYGLPLESADRDFYEEVIEVTAGGVTSILGMLILFMVAITRRVTAKFRH